MLNLKAIEHFLVVLIVAFGTQVAIGGAPVDLSSAAGRSATATAILMALWRVIRETGTGTPAETNQSTGTQTGA